MVQGVPLYIPTPSIRVAEWWVCRMRAQISSTWSFSATISRVERRPSGSIIRIIWVEVNWKMME